jgi:hypothetical protein
MAILVDGGGGVKTEKTMNRNVKPTPLPAKSRDWIEAECLTLAKQVRGAAGIQRVIIRRLRPIRGGPNWKAADVLPQPDLVLSGKVRAALTDLPSLYALEDERP